MLILLAGLLLCGAGIGCVGVAEGTDCPVIAHDEVAPLIEKTFTTGDNPTTPTVDLKSYHIVCLASGVIRGEYRFVSLVANYTCGGNANCPSDSAVSQFDFSCDGSAWDAAIFANSDHVRSDDPQSDFSTLAQEGCSYCATQAALQGGELGELTTDSTTHCVACSSDCNEGLMRCYGHNSTDCCNYYNHTTNSCIAECPSSEDEHYTIDNENTCTCQSGYTGALCDENVDECSQQDGSPCLNGGTCVDTEGSFNCTCPVGFHGNRCEENICDPNPCLNGGTCVNQNDMYTCECAHGFTGADCSEVDECSSSPCKNNATCSGGKNEGGFTCECRDGWEGDTCEECTRENCKTCSGSPARCEECAQGYELSDKDTCDKCSSGYEESDKGECVKTSTRESDKDDDDGLSSGTIAGIVIGCVIFLAAIVVVVVAAYFVIKKLRNN